MEYVSCTREAQNTEHLQMWIENMTRKKLLAPSSTKMVWNFFSRVSLQLEFFTFPVK